MAEEVKYFTCFSTRGKDNPVPQYFTCKKGGDGRLKILLQHMPAEKNKSKELFSAQWKGLVSVTKFYKPF